MSESGSPDVLPTPVPGEITPELRRRHAWHLVAAWSPVPVGMTANDAFHDHRDGVFTLARLGLELATNAAIVAAIVLVVLGLRRAGVRWAQPSPEMSMDSEQREAVAKALTPGGEVAPEHRGSIVAMARYRRHYRWVPGFFLLASALNGYAYSTETGVESWLYGLGALVCAGCTAYYVFAQRKARAIVESAAQ